MQEIERERETDAQSGTNSADQLTPMPPSAVDGSNKTIDFSFPFLQSCSQTVVVMCSRAHTHARAIDQNSETMWFPVEEESRLARRCAHTFLMRERGGCCCSFQWNQGREESTRNCMAKGEVRRSCSVRASCVRLASLPLLS